MAKTTIEIDLNDILCDEFGPPESLAESIHRQVVDKIELSIKKGMNDRIDKAVNDLLNRAIQESLIPRMDSIMADILDTEYVPIDCYGRKGTATTFRNQLVKTISEECVFKRDSYHNKPENAFSRAVESVVNDLCETLESEFKSQVDAEFTKRAVTIATETFAKCLGVK